jgi:hypothetical protein
MPLYEPSEAYTLLRHSDDSEERIWAICSLDNTPENYFLFWNIFLSDVDRQVRANALIASCYSKPKKIWEILEYVHKNDTKDNTFTRAVAGCIISLRGSKYSEGLRERL